jgi:hypothetical protein
MTLMTSPGSADPLQLQLMTSSFVTAAVFDAESLRLVKPKTFTAWLKTHL